MIGFFQLGWPALAGSAAATLLGAWIGRMPGAPDQAAQAWVAIALILAVVVILSFGGTIERMLEYFAWTMLGVVFLFLLIVNIAFVPMAHWFEHVRGLLPLLRPAGSDRLGAHRRAGRDGRLGRHRQPDGHQLDPRQGLRHGRQGGRHPERRRRARDPAVARRHACSRRRRRTWCAGASGCATCTSIRSGCGALFCFLGMFLNVNLATAIIPHGTDLQGLAAGAYQAEYLARSGLASGS